MSSSNITDSELMAQISRGNGRAFRVLFDRYYTPLTIFADRMLGDTDAAVDVVQSLFVAVYEQRETLSVSNVKSFLYQSTRNRCLNEIKHLKIHNKYADSQVATESELSDDVEENIAAAELQARLTNAIAQLPAQCRKIFEMSRFDGLTNAEIAEQLNLSKRTVETQISKALASLRKSLGPMLFAILFECL